MLFNIYSDCHGTNEVKKRKICLYNLIFEKLTKYLTFGHMRNELHVENILGINTRFDFVIYVRS